MRASSKKSIVNEQIDVEQVRLVGEEGEQLGIVMIGEAREKAAAAKLDLVLISPEAEPPVCKLMDYGKHVFEAKKQKAANKKKQRRTQVKEIKFRPGTEIGDYQVKLRNLIRFLEDGDKAKVSLRFRGREMAHQHLGMELVTRIKDDLSEFGVVEQEPKMEGRQIVMVLAPTKKRA
ncbi:MAG: translation initiation factor IF-3 [Deltaproteobacteria bacterium]|jgi:translation initiation factor IF-3|nr:translation initiation factor IF-3 [Deltaproteobacteria bacterium]|tara:strand:+ start:2731 stop:3258 length:528 start_codon:yes stop_codon:yes gene_type:complete